jgi:hypothetical protein
MDAETRRSVEGNLFRPALPAIEPWDDFPWHLDSHGRCDSWKPHSSQALAIDLFGTLKAERQAKKDVVLGDLAGYLGLDPEGPWRVELEWIDRANHLREPRQTQIDAAAFGKKSIVFFESKFTELHGGACSQVLPRAKGANLGVIQCNGNYAEQINPVNTRKSRCALSAKEIRYWDIIPDVFELGADHDHSPCPFAGSWFQWMRNLVLAKETAKMSGRRAGFVVAYADHPAFPFASKVGSEDWKRLSGLIRQAVVPMLAISHQGLVRRAITGLEVAGLEPGPWPALEAFIEQKISAVASSLKWL